MQHKSNVDKFEEIEDMMTEAKELMEPYKESLKERYDYMKVLRKEYSNLTHALGRIEQQIEREAEEIEVDEDVKVVSHNALERIDEHIEAIEEDNKYGEDNNALDELKRAREQLGDKIDADSISNVYRTLNKMGITVEEINVLMDVVEATRSENKDAAQNIIRRIERVRIEYISSFVDYRESLEQGEDVGVEIQDVISSLEDAGFTRYADELTDAKPDLLEERGKRPNPQPLLDVLRPIRSAGLKYFQSNNKNSDSHDLNVAFADEVRNTRRALLEGREYIGTENAFESLLAAYSDLSTYMYARYHQLGGEPVNYHGHDDRKK